MSSQERRRGRGRKREEENEEEGQNTISPMISMSSYFAEDSNHMQVSIGSMKKKSSRSHDEILKTKKKEMSDKRALQSVKIINYGYQDRLKRELEKVDILFLHIKPSNFQRAQIVHAKKRAQKSLDRALEMVVNPSTYPVQRIEPVQRPEDVDSGVLTDMMVGQAYKEVLARLLARTKRDNGKEARLPPVEKWVTNEACWTEKEGMECYIREITNFAVAKARNDHKNELKQGIITWWNRTVHGFNLVTSMSEREAENVVREKFASMKTRSIEEKITKMFHHVGMETSLLPKVPDRAVVMFRVSIHLRKQAQQPLWHDQLQKGLYVTMAKSDGSSVECVVLGVAKAIVFVREIATSDVVKISKSNVRSALKLSCLAYKDTLGEHVGMVNKGLFGMTEWVGYRIAETEIMHADTDMKDFVVSQRVNDMRRRVTLAALAEIVDTSEFFSKGVAEFDAKFSEAFVTLAEVSNEVC